VRLNEESSGEIIILLMYPGTVDFQDSVLKFRRKASRVNKKKLVFLDATGMKANPQPRHGLAPAGREAKVRAERAESYEPRVDLLGAVTLDEPLAAVTTTPEERKNMGIKGFRKPQVKDFFRVDLAPVLAEKEEKMIIVMDKGLNFKPEEVKREIKAGGADVEEVWSLPTSTAKLVSPLDNCLWHDLKDAVRKQRPHGPDELADAFEHTFMALSETEIKPHYRHCALTRRSDLRQGLNET
jgi:hypothetical protein